MTVARISCVGIIFAILLSKQIGDPSGQRTLKKPGNGEYFALYLEKSNRTTAKVTVLQVLCKLTQFCGYERPMFSPISIFRFKNSHAKTRKGLPGVFCRHFEVVYKSSIVEKLCDIKFRRVRQRC